VRRARTRYELAAGDLVMWDASHPHAGSAKTPWASRLVVFETASLAGVLAHDRDPRDLEIRTPVTRDPLITRAFDSLYARVTEPAARLERDDAVIAFGEALLGRHHATRSSAKLAARIDPAFRRACEFLRAHLDANVGLEALAAAAGTDRHRLTRLFRAATGASPHQFLIAQRVGVARRLLEAGRQDVAAIAAATGFVDQSHLHRHFGRLLGITPREYARRFARA
ncbi:MAG TPA: AraC family transcriptional regulator, partial [Kofleriaceae bacterium]